MGNEVGILAPTDEATMARKIRMGQVTVAKVARGRLDEIVNDPNRPPAAELIAGGDALDADGNEMSSYQEERDRAIDDLNKAKENLAGFTFVQYKLCNIDIPPCRQGFASHSFNMVVATNVLHATTILKCMSRTKSRTPRAEPHFLSYYHLFCSALC